MSRRLPVPTGGDPEFLPLTDARMYWQVQRARVQVAVREGFQAWVGAPVERMTLGIWKRCLPGGIVLEKLGLPRRPVEQELADSLIIHVRPRELIKIRDWRGIPKRKRPSSSAFIWDGDWDLQRGDLRHGSRYRFISDLNVHSDDLTESDTFQRLKARSDKGSPLSSYRQGFLLDSEERILGYLSVYLNFMNDMKRNGFNRDRGKDELGVAVSRDGRLIKINRGLHRLAMAQYLDLPTVPVKVKAVHREWWEKVTQNAHGAEALERVVEALQHCEPETEPGPLDPDQPPENFIWPS
ncbi:hypothetical protein [Vreelandella janggokensis]|uniref:hypothetical protein n=1 Tax=Vreelandella janggokensis TaxID=370767 RepID=UPI002864D9F9|nr:hypothetical protein [Halomonas janggokensis]MDR5885685.1 hypothetical protein [Halomonas janggokensis]